MRGRQQLSAEERVRRLWAEGREPLTSGVEKLAEIADKRNRPKALVARHSLHPHGKFALVLYPKPEHALDFASSQAHLKKGGPAELYPGSVGSIHAVVREKGISLIYVQGHFVQQRAGRTLLKRSLATSYGGWKYHLFNELFKQARRLEIRRVVFSLMYEEPLQTEKDFLRAAEQNGFKRAYFGTVKAVERE